MTLSRPVGGVQHRTRFAILVLVLGTLFVAMTACAGGSDGNLDDADLGTAPAFSVTDQFGEEYEFTPGDGKDHVFVFYMGYF